MGSFHSTGIDGLSVGEVTRGVDPMEEGGTVRIWSVEETGIIHILLSMIATIGLGFRGLGFPQ